MTSDKLPRVFISRGAVIEGDVLAVEREGSGGPKGHRVDRLRGVRNAGARDSETITIVSI